MVLKCFFFYFKLQRILKKLEQDGVRNVLFTNCLKQVDSNVKKVTVLLGVDFIFDWLESNQNYYHKCVMVSPFFFFLQLVPMVQGIIESNPRFNREEVWSTFYNNKCSHVYTFYVDSVS